MTGNIEVVVIGGGYAGVLAANRLTQRDDVTVTLVNPRPAFVERLRACTSWRPGRATRSSTTARSCPGTSG
jgi:2-polyprenyl-6-methoxyphenol hydroxylase-like FAD-dependent oxidoreductase